MDLLGRKSRRKLEEYAVLAAGYVKLLQSKNDDARNRIRLIEIENTNLKNEAVKLSLQLEEASKKTSPPIKSHPLYLNETEEDIEFAFKNELIDRAEYEDMLRQLEFDNSNITFDLEPI